MTKLKVVNETPGFLVEYGTQKKFFAHDCEKEAAEFAKSVNATVRKVVMTWEAVEGGMRSAQFEDAQKAETNYVVRKTYADGKFAYFFDENENVVEWTPEKSRAAQFPNRLAAENYAKRTEAHHAERIKDGKVAASDVVVLEA